MIYYILIICFAVWSYLRYKKMRMFLSQGVPGPKPNFIAGTLEIRRMGLLSCLQYCREKYGRTFSVCFGGTPAVYTTEVDLLQTVFVKNFDNFRNRNFARLGSGKIHRNILALRDGEWKRARSILSPAFSLSKLKLMSGKIENKCELLLREIEKESNLNGKVNVYGIFQRLTLDVICECAFAMEMSSITKYKESEGMLLAMRKMFRQPSTTAIAMMFPGVARFISRVFTRKLFERNRDHVDNLLAYCRQVIKQRRQHNSRQVDVLQFMLDSSESDTERYMNEEEILANTFVFLLAGYETTSTALSFTTYLLAVHPDIQEKLYREIQANISDTSKVDFDDVRKLSYLEGVWKEALRLYPPAAGLVGRETAKEFHTGEFTLPKGSWIMTSPLLVHLDPDYWPDPYKFDPERFINKDNIVPGTYLAFGEGPRNCIGKRFAEIEGKIALVKLISNFELRACEDTQPHPLKMVQTGPTAYPEGETIYIQFIKR